MSCSGLIDHIHIALTLSLQEGAMTDASPNLLQQG
jgi:hypothetical protein